MKLLSGLAIATALAAALTIAVAWPVVRAPNEMMFGNEIAGRHHDAYTVALQIGTGGAVGPYSQPMTDKLGWLFTTFLDPIAAYNLLVLITFPLTAAATYALARYLSVPHSGALVAAIIFTFSPFHIAQAAYHPHIAQTQWVPLYFLALFALIDRPSVLRAVGLVLACGALVLSNDYAGLIGAVTTPVALVAYWLTSPRAARKWARLIIPAGVLAVMAAGGIVAIARIAPQAFVKPSPYAVAISEVAKYSARWWAYFTPPVDHPVFGAMATGVMGRAEIVHELVEQQVYVSFALLALAITAAGLAVWRWRQEPALRPVLGLLAIALVAGVVSIGPISGHCNRGSWAVACRLHDVAPMFRSYARFAVVVQLAIAIAAAAGFSWLLRRSKAAGVAGAALVACVGFEYAPVPWHAHDVLPTQAHRWLARQSVNQRSLDCMHASIGESYVPALMHRNLVYLSPAVRSCTDPQLGPKLAALGYTHVIVRRDERATPLASPATGLALVASFPDAQVYFVTADIPSVVTLRTAGFYEYEHTGGDWWRWMEPEGRWTVTNTTAVERRATLSAGLESAGDARTLTLMLDGKSAGTIDVRGPLHEYTVGPLAFSPGEHTIEFRASGAPFKPSEHSASTDERDLSVSFRNPRWNVQ